MSETSKENPKHSHGWLDHLAISMAFICAVHCLVVPIAIVALPLIKVTFFVSEDFHLWMLLAVFPTTLASVFMGCKKHRDKWVGIFCILGLSFLTGSFIAEQVSHKDASVEGGHAHCSACEQSILSQPLNSTAWINTLGGLFLILAHSRNFYLCRKLSCGHDICQDKDCCS